MLNEDSMLTVFAGLWGVLIIIVLLIIALAVVTCIAQWKLFKKAGKKGWEAIVPFYNTWVLYEISGLNWWYFLITIAISLISSSTEGTLSFILSLGSYYISFITYYNLAKKMKQNEMLYGILGIFVPVVAVLILGFSKDITYDGTIETKPNGIF